MNLVEIEKLAEVTADPAVTILCTLDRRRPGNLEDPRRLAALRKQAVDTVTATHDGKNVRTLLDRIDAAVASVDLDHPSEAVAIFVSADESHVLPLPFPLSSRVVVDNTFATRDLVRAARRSLRARVLVLDAQHARCFEATGTLLHEVDGHGFPLHLTPPLQEDTPRRDLPIGEHEQAEAHRTVLRAVDAALTALQATERLPLVVAAPVRDLAFFDEVTRNGSDVIGRVHGNFLHERVPEIERAVAPALDAELARRSAEAVHRANEAVGTGAVTRFAKVSAAAREGRGRELIIEEDLQVSSATGEGPDDPVDEVVEAVLTHGGEVTMVPHDALADHGGIVLTLRY